MRQYPMSQRHDLTVRTDLGLIYEIVIGIDERPRFKHLRQWIAHVGGPAWGPQLHACYGWTFDEAKADALQMIAEDDR